MKKLVLLTATILLSVQLTIGQNKKSLTINCDRYASFIFNFKTSSYDIESDRNLVTQFVLLEDWKEISYITSEGSTDRIVRFGETSVDIVKSTTSFRGTDRSGRENIVIFDVKDKSIRIIVEIYGQLLMQYFPIKSIE